MSLTTLFRSTVGKKLWVAVTGLGLSGFVLTHMAGNLLILVGPEAYNRYSHALVSNPLLPVAELGLLALFLVHVGVAISLTRANRAARPVGNQKHSGAKEARFGSRSMIYTGILVFWFLVSHLWTFKYGPHYTVTYGGAEMRDLHRLILEKFQQTGFVAWYLFSLVILGVHLSHGFAATLQSLGLASVRQDAVRKVGYAFAAVVAVGFIAQPLYVYFSGSR